MLAPVTPEHPVPPRLGARAAAAGLLLLLSGLTLIRNPVYASPLRLWQETVRHDPRSGRGWLYLGDTLEFAGRREEAAVAYRRAVEAEPEFPDSHSRYSRFLLDSGKPEEALLHAEEALRLVPGGISSAQIYAARALIALGRPPEALLRLDEVKSLYHSESTYLEARGKALDALGDADGAIESFRRIAREDAVDRTVPRRLAELLIARGEAREAEGTLRDRLGRDADPDLHNLLGVALAAQGRFTEAEAAFGEAVRLEPGTPLFRENLARAREDAARSLPHGEPQTQPRPGPQRRRP